MPEPRALRVFLCHAEEDKPAIQNLFALLKKQPWIEPWLDEADLPPGADWDWENDQALRAADAILVCLSQESVAGEAYLQKEFKRVLDFIEGRTEGAAYIIPVRLSEFEAPLQFQGWQWMEYFQPGAQKKLLQALRWWASSLRILSAPASAKMTPGGRPVRVFGDLEFVTIPAGDFYMGADDIEEARPRQIVTQLDYDFYLARFPVTNRQYSAMAREVGAPRAAGRASHPVANVSWYDAQKFVEWLNDKYRAELPDGYRFCLPSEAEWEKAARGFNGNQYPWGDAFDAEKCNTGKDSPDEGGAEEGGAGEGQPNDTTPVGAYSPQGDAPFGCADMAGNVWEWTRSLWGLDAASPAFLYPYSFDDEREDETAGESMMRVARGGSFDHDGKRARCAVRLAGFPSMAHAFIGFRVAISLA